MTQDKTRELLEIQADLGGFRTGNSARLFLSEVQRGHGQAEVDQLIREPRLEEIFGFKPGARINGGLAI